MTYDELIKKFSKKNNIDYDDAREFIDGFFTLIKYGIATEDKITIPKLGTFTPKTYKSKLIKNKETGEVEIIPEKLVPHFTPSRAKNINKTKKKKEKKIIEKKETIANSPSKEEKSSITSEEIKEANGEKVPLWKILFLNDLILIIIVVTIFFISESKIKKRLTLKIKREIKNILYEEGLTYDAIQELVDTKYMTILEETRSNTERFRNVISTQLLRLEKKQELSLKKLKEVEKKLKLKIKKLISPSLKKRHKKAEIKIIQYKVKKNDTLWSISAKYLKNPYNWVGLYKSNGERIKNPDLIYPGEIIFIPIIKEY